ncbi:MAG: hypothetical protein CMM92_01535 [Rickettsiales bacterium]|nr:hypothetical protein [Rickettsiales bacterium]RPG15499.1 MAG: hypothetical protein CBD55_001525 [Pelagibacteraceae bacterium TMED195]|tara:strand:- start:1112 stop:2005 length:894 start_codon:yes stop_codon:yes gene_type:complete
MIINIINLDQDGWILTKISKKLVINLRNLGHKVYLGKKPLKNVDVNHYIIFLFQKENEALYFRNTVNTSMLTHVNDELRFNKLRKISKFLDAGIAFSDDHRKFIKSKSLGLKNIFFVLPPADGDLEIKKINFGIFTNLYRDGRKEEKIFYDTFSRVNPDFAKLTIIGKGWKPYVEKLRNKGMEIDYDRFFFRWNYLKKLQSLDYLIYLGQDEGSMSFMDAIQIGLKTIMIPQGFQKDLQKFITHKLDPSLKNFFSTINKITNQKKKFAGVKKILTWENYAKEHVMIWEKLIEKKLNH